MQLCSSFSIVNLCVSPKLYHIPISSQKWDPVDFSQTHPVKPEIRQRFQASFIN